jgi:hypothetical protein
MKFIFKKNAQGYALPLALILVAIFSIFVASVIPRSNLFNQTQLSIKQKFQSDQDETMCKIDNPNSAC